MALPHFKIDTSDEQENDAGEVTRIAVGVFIDGQLDEDLQVWEDLSEPGDEESQSEAVAIAAESVELLLVNRLVERYGVAEDDAEALASESRDGGLAAW